MPRINGFELLARLKADPVMRRVPVVMLSTSQDERDIDRTYDLGANAYVTKPVDLPQFLALVAELLKFWLKLAALPTRPEA